MSNQEIKELINYGFIPLSVSITKEGDKYKKTPKVEGWQKLNLKTYKSKLDLTCPNFGILTGKEHNIIVVDIDVRDNGLKTWKKLVKEHGLEDDTICVKTPSGGYHYYFVYDDEASKYFNTSSNSIIFEGKEVGIDIRSDGGFVVVPPSKQGNKKYEWVNGLDTLLADFPEWLYKYAKPIEQQKDLYVSDGIMDILDYSELDLAKHFLKNNKDIYRLAFDNTSEKSQLYKWNDNIKIYDPIKNSQLGIYIANFFNEIDVKSLLKVKKYREARLLSKFIKSIGSKNKMNNIASLVISELTITTKDFDKQKEIKTYLLNFRNGCYDMKKNLFRERVKEDYVVKFLDYNYKSSKDTDISKIRGLIKNTSNDDEVVLEFILSYLGYCMTGETNEQKFLILYGPSASNGKTTLQEIFSRCLKEYTYKIDRETFNYKYDKFHKQLCESARPKRLVFLEEMNKNKLDISKLKEFVDGNEINCNIMYGTSQLLKIDSKLMMSTNNRPSFDNDSGIARRGIMIECKNKFVNKEEYEKNKHKKNYYLKDSKLIDSFDDVKNKLSFINLLIPYAVKYYNSGLKIPKVISEEFKGICEDNDKMKSFLNDTIDITNNDSDRISKLDFSDAYNIYYKTKLSFSQLLSDIKRHNIDYHRKKRCDGKQGCLVGIKFKNYKDEGYDFDALDN
jgi:P4 family phage/plasmid primase-like protien